MFGLDCFNASGSLSIRLDVDKSITILNKLKTVHVEFQVSAVPALDEISLTVATGKTEFSLPIAALDDSKRFTAEFPAAGALQVSAA